MYIDPNTGGMLFQVLAALLAVFSGFALLFSSKIRALFARSKRAMRESSSEEADSAGAQPTAGDSSQDSSSPN